MTVVLLLIYILIQLTAYMIILRVMVKAYLDICMFFFFFFFEIQINIYFYR